MASKDDQVLRTAKEIIVKFIETGRVSLAAFPDGFKTVYNAVKETVDQGEKAPLDEESGPETGGKTLEK